MLRPRRPPTRSVLLAFSPQGVHGHVVNCSELVPIVIVACSSPEFVRHLILTRVRIADPAAAMSETRSRSTRRSGARVGSLGNLGKPQDHARIRFWRRTA